MLRRSAPRSGASWRSTLPISIGVRVDCVALDVPPQAAAIVLPSEPLKMTL